MSNDLATLREALEYGRRKGFHNQNDIELVKFNEAIGILDRLQAQESREALCYIRTLNGEPDWSEDCVGLDEATVMDGYTEKFNYQTKEFEPFPADECYAAVPLYTSKQALSAEPVCTVEIRDSHSGRFIYGTRWQDDMKRLPLGHHKLYAEM